MRRCRRTERIAGVTAILGLNAFHGDAAAALVVDGRWSPPRRRSASPASSTAPGSPRWRQRWCLEDAGLAPEDLDHVAISRDPRANLGRKARRTLRHGDSRPPRAVAREERRPGGGRARHAGAGPGHRRGAIRARMHNVEHHLAHAASAFFVSPFDEAAVLSVDGFGDFASTMLAVGRGNRLDVIDRVLFPHSLGSSTRRSASGWASPSTATRGRSWAWRPTGTPSPIWSACAT